MPTVGIASIEVERVVNASERRGPLQKKIGSNLTPEEFEAMASAGEIGHVGLVESVALVAAVVGWEVDTVEESVEPVVADRPIETDHFNVAPGRVRGIEHRARAREGARERVSLRLRMALDEPEPRDRIRIEADPPVDLTIAGGYQGDKATAAMLANAARLAVAAPAGLLTAAELFGMTLTRGVRFADGKRLEDK
jgi:4-hydroxy-tetrahydrodipicolinate reductase